MNTTISPSVRALCTKIWAVFTAVSLVFGSGLFINTARAAVPTPIFESSFETSEPGGVFGQWTLDPSPGNKWKSDASAQPTSSGSKSARITGDTDDEAHSITADISTEGYEDIELSFYYLVPEALEEGQGDYVLVQWSVNGSTWNTALDLTGADENNTWVYFSDTLTGADDNSDFQLRFIGEMGAASTDEVRIDDVVIGGFAVDGGDTDTDSDGVLDEEDNCPETYNPDQEDWNDNGVGDACEDSDEDGVNDDTDNCVTIENADQADQDGDDIGDVCDDDVDGDDVVNEEDNCPETYNPGQEDSDGDDIGNACDDYDNGDDDGDGVDNETDQCPDTPADTEVDDFGCAEGEDPTENTEPLCTDGEDNDGDELVDEDDPDCAEFYPVCEEDSFVIESDDETGLFEGGFASLLSFIHTAWTADIPGAEWIWSLDGVNDPTAEEAETFVEEFWVGDTVHEAILDIASDNEYTVWINGVEVAASTDEDNFRSTTQDQYDVAGDLLVGQVNTLEIEVVNKGVAGSSPTSNPAGLLYSLDVTAGSCDGEDPQPDESEIIQPEVDEETSGTTELEAYYADENGDGNDTVQWAVRAGTCAAGTNTVLGNVDGFDDPYTWDGTNFLADFDTTQVENGEYCFVFNPKEDSGDENQRLTREFTVNNPVYQCLPEATGDFIESTDDEGIDAVVTEYELDGSTLGNGDSFELFVEGDAAAEGDFDDQVRLERTADGFDLYFYGNEEGERKMFSGSFWLNDDVDYSSADVEYSLTGDYKFETGKYPDSASVDTDTGEVSFTLYVTTGDDMFSVVGLGNMCSEDDGGDDNGGGGDDEGEVLATFSCDAGILHMNTVVDEYQTRLYSVDELTLATADVASYEDSHKNNVAVDSDGIVYSVADDDHGLYVLNPDGSDPDRTFIGDTGLGGIVPASGFGPDGLLYVLEKDPYNKLYSIDPDTGEATELLEVEEFEVNGGDLVVNGDYKVIYVHVDGDVWSIDLLDGYSEEYLGTMPEGESYTGLALIDGVYYVTEKDNANALHSFILDEGFSYEGYESFDEHTVYAGDAASCPVEENYRNGISGWKFYDFDFPFGEYFDETEWLLGDWPIRLYQDVEGDWVLLDEQETDEDGQYSFNNLEDGVYYVCEVEDIDKEVDWVQTYPADDSSDDVVEKESGDNTEAEYCYRVSLDADETVTDLYFGNYDGEIDDGSEDESGGGGGIISSGSRANGGGGGSVLGVSTGPNGTVLGASTGPSCELWLPEFIGDGSSLDWALVLRLQVFLNAFEGEELELSGVYDEATADAVARFQLKYRNSVLGPWGLSLPTRLVWITTTNVINGMVDPRCQLPLPGAPLVLHPGEVNHPMTPSQIFSDGFESGDTSSWAR